MLSGLPTRRLEDHLQVRGDGLRLGLRHLGKLVPLYPASVGVEVDHAALPRRSRQFDLHGALDRVVVVADDELDASQAALDEPLKQAPPRL